VIERGKTTATPPAHIVFDYTGSGKNIAALQTVLGQSGSLVLARLTLEAIDQAEDHLVLIAITDAGALLDDGQTRRMFRLPATVESIQEGDKSPAILSEPLNEACQSLMNTIAQRNA